MLDVSRLRLLRTVVATGSIRASASTLGYTPSAISQQLGLLQRETGLRLLERVGRGIEPTAAGRTLAAEAGSLFEALSRVEGVVEDLRAGRMGSLSIGYFASAGAVWLPAVVAAVHEEFPELRLDLRMTEARGAEMTAPDVDIFVSRAEAEPAAGSVQIRRLVDDPYVAVVRADHRIAGLHEVPMSALASERWVDNDLNDGACRQVLMAACMEAGFAPEFAVETHDYQTAIRFVATGIGITVVPGLGINELPDGLTTVSVVAPTPVRHINVAVKKSAAEHPAVLRVLELLETAVKTGAAPTASSRRADSRKPPVARRHLAT
ncbi:LysR family transcriptional regulator [Phytoactinopolyspora mesophila]|uniref:LysR family transcriptional regulator n=1 Tax=Phytoactinopolyspora mesophila TaxID=2650750 RepID=A0A7K3M0B5_9ACTN|nr:LysR family transcriptional regulator [Phytoactinopolyspora mesophila]NDL55898.1 LysR family transcriptional regulator [Phytoactinopolyspora mesophila]